jgi:hypothetical protein
VNVSALVAIKGRVFYSLRINFIRINDRAAFRFCSPYICHPKKMPLQSWIINIVDELHTV